MFKKHIMISYHRKSIDICRKIYTNLKKRNYPVWIDYKDMFDDILISKAQAIENASVVLVCIDKEYFENGYQILEVEYALVKKIKCILCLMEKDWFEISNISIDFSDSKQFNQAFDELIYQINSITDMPRSKSQVLVQLINRTLEQNEFLLKLIDQSIKQSKHNQSTMFIKRLFTIVIFVVLIILIFK